VACSREAEFLRVLPHDLLDHRCRTCGKELDQGEKKARKEKNQQKGRVEWVWEKEPGVTVGPKPPMASNRRREPTADGVRPPWVSRSSSCETCRKRRHGQLSEEGREKKVSPGPGQRDHGPASAVSDQRSVTADR